MSEAEAAGPDVVPEPVDLDTNEHNPVPQEEQSKAEPKQRKPRVDFGVPAAKFAETYNASNSVKEVATALGMPVGNVYARAHQYKKSGKYQLKDMPSVKKGKKAAPPPTTEE